MRALRIIRKDGSVFAWCRRLKPTVAIKPGTRVLLIEDDRSADVLFYQTEPSALAGTLLACAEEDCLRSIHPQNNPDHLAKWAKRHPQWPGWKKEAD